MYSIYGLRAKNMYAIKNKNKKMAVMKSYDKIPDGKNKKGTTPLKTTH